MCSRNSHGDITAGAFQASKSSATGRPGAGATRTGRQSWPRGPGGRACPSKSQKRSPPTVSATRWMRVSLPSLSTRWRRQVSKIQHSPAAMLTSPSPHWNRTDGVVTIGTCTRMRSRQ